MARFILKESVNRRQEDVFLFIARRFIKIIFFLDALDVFADAINSRKKNLETALSWNRFTSKIVGSKTRFNLFDFPLYTYLKQSGSISLIRDVSNWI